jgi:hypothetical protein
MDKDPFLVVEHVGMPLGEFPPGGNFHVNRFLLMTKGKSIHISHVCLVVYPPICCNSI